jgi:hypothetical protein
MSGMNYFMKLFVKQYVYLLFLFISHFFAYSACASDVYLKIDNNEVGQGVLRQRGNECLVIVPAHVVENSFKIDATLSDRKKYSAELLELFPGDLGLLRLTNDDPSICRHVSWSSQANVDALLETEKRGELRTMMADGSIRITDVDIVSYDKYRNINVRPKNKEDAFSKGESGSPLYIDGQFSGVLLTVNNDIGNVIRQDAITNTLALFFRDTLQKSKQNSAQLNKARKETNSPPENSPSKIQEFSGNIAKSAMNVHVVKLEENSPVRLSFSATGDAEKYNVEIWDSARRVVYRNPAKHYSGLETFNIPFTPPRNDTYSLCIIGTEGEGKYSVKISSIASDSQLRAETNVIQVGGYAAEGMMAQGAVAEYRINLEQNSPVRLILSATGDQWKFNVEIYNSSGKSAYRNSSLTYSGTETFTIPFTPQKSGIYSLRIVGAEGEGRYSVKVKSIALDSQLRAESNVLHGGDDAVDGVIAQGAVAEYRINVEATKPIRLHFFATGDRGKYNVEILDSTGKAIYLDPYKRYSGTEEATIPFSTLKSDTYSLRILGIEGECKYSLAVEP